ncbi:MAG TPA: ZIP family metal transporter [Bacteroidia bacterium]|jgi:zinc and cadmium transporter|nr:ZIP family metal transporter [Bacteroidia bacterium]
MTIHLLYLLLFITVIASGCSVLIFKVNNKTLKLILSFSGAYLLGITVLHLIPEVYSNTTTTTGIFVLLGFLLQIFIEYFSEGIEHGHIHIHKDAKGSFPVTIMMALSIHSFMEGMPLSGNYNETKQSLATGIILHNLPIAIALMSMLIQSGLKKGWAIFWLIIFALMTPIGALTGNVLEESIGFITHYEKHIMAVVVGIFLHVSTTILFESSEHHRFHLIKLATILTGIALSVYAI